MPLSLTLRLSLRSGCVYKFQDRRLTSGEPHYFVVVNRDPIGDKLLLLTICTSKIETARRLCRHQIETLVEIDVGKVAYLPLQTAINCNQLFDMSLEAFSEKSNEVGFETCDPLPSEIFLQIKAAILISKQLSEDEKKLI